MLVTLVCFKDKQLETYTIPQATDLLDIEAIKEDCTKQIVKSDKRVVFKGKNLVKIGTFDTKTGTVEACDPEFLLNCDEVISNAEDYERSKKDA